MEAFAIITGVVTLISFLLQIWTKIPKYKAYLTAATWFLFGMTAGVGIASLSGTSIHIPRSFTPNNLVGIGLFAGSGLLIVSCFAASIFITDSARRSEATKIGSAVSGFLVFLLMFFRASFFPPESGPYLTYDEHIECAIVAANKGNFERSLELLRDAKSLLSIGDDRRTKLDALIRKIVDQQSLVSTTALKTSVSPTETTKTSQ